MGEIHPIIAIISSLTIIYFFRERAPIYIFGLCGYGIGYSFLLAFRKNNRDKKKKKNDINDITNGVKNIHEPTKIRLNKESGWQVGERRYTSVERTNSGVSLGSVSSSGSGKTSGKLRKFRKSISSTTHMRGFFSGKYSRSFSRSSSFDFEQVPNEFNDNFTSSTPSSFRRDAQGNKTWEIGERRYPSMDRSSQSYLNEAKGLNDWEIGERRYPSMDRSSQSLNEAKGSDDWEIGERRYPSVERNARIQTNSPDLTSLQSVASTPPPPTPTPRSLEKELIKCDNKKSSAELMDERLTAFDEKRMKAAQLVLSSFRSKIEQCLQNHEITDENKNNNTTNHCDNDEFYIYNLSNLNDDDIHKNGESVTLEGLTYHEFIKYRCKKFLTDDTLLRYLRARDSDEDAAFQALLTSLKWRMTYIDPIAWKTGIEYYSIIKQEKEEEKTKDIVPNIQKSSNNSFNVNFNNEEKNSFKNSNQSYQHHLSLLPSCRMLSHSIHFEDSLNQKDKTKREQIEISSMKTWQSWSPSPVCLHCRSDPSAHCFYRVGLDRMGRHVIYSCAGRARNRVVTDNMEHMAYEFERIFDHNSAPGKVVWVIDFKGFGLRDCNPAMGSTALPMFAAHYPERMGQIVLVDPPALFAGLWAGIQPILDPVTKSKVVFLRGPASFKAYADVQWRGLEPDDNEGTRKGGGDIDPDMATFLKRIASLSGGPGSFPMCISEGIGDEGHRIDDNQLCFLRDPIATERIRRTIAFR